MLRARRIVIAAYFFVFWIGGVWMPYFPLYLLHLGYDGRQIGIVSALQPALRWSSAILWAYAADRWRIRHRLLLIAALGGALAYVPLLFVHRFAAMVAVTSAIALLHGAVVPMLDATVMDHLPRLGGDYGRLRMWGSVAFVMGSLVSAPLIHFFSPAIVPVLLLIAAAAVVPPLAWVPPEQLGHAERFRAPWALLTPPLSAFLITAFLIQLSCGAWSGFFAVHTAALGFSDAVPGVTWALAVTAEVLLMFWGQRFIEWISPPQIILSVLLITVARWGLTAMARSETLVVGLQIGHAFTFSAFHLAALLLLSRLVPVQNSTGGQALYGLVAFGLGGSIGPWAWPARWWTPWVRAGCLRSRRWWRCWDLFPRSTCGVWPRAPGCLRYRRGARRLDDGENAFGIVQIQRGCYASPGSTGGESMDLSYTPEQEAFRRQVRKWIKANLPAREKDAPPPEYGDPKRIQQSKAWQRTLYEAGYLAMGWPKDYGGQDADVVQQTIVNEELLLARAPALIGMMGIQMVGPTLIQHGTEEQRRRYLPKILSAEEIWCQGYSEPGSGSDLASLKTRADLVGDEFIVNGQKVWTSNAQLADWVFCLVRTDPSAPKHRGISYLLIDMKTPGITIRPLIQMTGDPGFNEVFFEDVRVPRRNLVGELNQGWLVANATLAHERNMLGSTVRTQQMFNGVLRLARQRQRKGRPAAEDPVIRQRLADLMIRVDAMKYHAYRQLTDSIKHRPPGIGASVNKLVSTELNHDITAMALEIMGAHGFLARNSRRVIDRGVWPVEFMFTLGLIIGGGTSQIQKNIISERGLGMPRH